MTATTGEVTPVLEEHTADRAAAAATTIAERLADDELVVDCVAHSERLSPHPYGWGGASLYSGEAGSALVFAEAVAADPHRADVWAGRARAALTRAAAGTRAAPLDSPSLSCGIAGLAFAAAATVRVEPRFGPALERLDEHLAARLRICGPVRAASGCSASDYDVILGTAGALAHPCALADPSPPLRDAVGAAIGALIELSRPDAAGARGWELDPVYYPVPEHHHRYPHGFVDMGLAHGVPGVLSALAIAWTTGHRPPGLDRAITDVAAVVVDSATADHHGPDWPAGIPLAADGTAVPAAAEPARTAWCYGTPGVACSLLTAATALGDDRLRSTAIRAFDAAVARWRAVGGIGSASLCHGLAGMLVIAVRFARESGTVAARAAVADLTEAVLEHCDPGLPLGVRDHIVPGTSLDCPSLLTGAAGVALALWDAADRIDGRWARSLLIT